MRRLKRRLINAAVIVALIATAGFLAWWFFTNASPYLGALCLGLVLGLAAAPRLQRWSFFGRRLPLGLQTVSKSKKKWWHLGLGPFASQKVNPS